MNATASVNPNSSLSGLQVGGLCRLSTCDWPGELVSTIFCQGCAWDCAYCHNPHLRPTRSPARIKERISWDSVLQFLAHRRGLLDAVVFSGGEPTLQSALLHAVRTVRSFGFRVGLHTSGASPERLAEVLPWVDWVGFDVKAPFHAYARITGVEESGAHVRESLRLLLASGVPYEVRTTVHPELLSTEELLELRDFLLSRGVTHYAVQCFRAAGVCATRLRQIPEQRQLILPPGFHEGFTNFALR